MDIWRGRLEERGEGHEAEVPVPSLGRGEPDEVEGRLFVAGLALLDHEVRDRDPPRRPRKVRRGEKNVPRVRPRDSPGDLAVHALDRGRRGVRHGHGRFSTLAPGSSRVEPPGGAAYSGRVVRSILFAAMLAVALCPAARAD